MKRIAPVAIALMLVAAGAHAGEEETTPPQTGTTELIHVDGPYEETWVRPDLDLSSYDRLYLWDPVFEFRDIEPARRSRTTMSMLRGNQSGPYGVRSESQEKLEEIVTKTFTEEFQRTEVFTIADELGPGTLIVASGVLDIVSNVPGPYTGTADLYLAAVGEATIVFELVDAATGEVLARAAERRRIQPPGREYEVNTTPANSATIWSDVERWAQDQAHRLRKALEKAHRADSP